MSEKIQHGWNELLSKEKNMFLDVDLLIHCGLIEFFTPEHK